MQTWVIAAAIATIVITGALTYALWRMNAPAMERARKDAERDGGGGVEGAFVPATGSHHSDRHDGHDDGGGSSDGGGDGGGGE